MRRLLIGVAAGVAIGIALLQDGPALAAISAMPATQARVNAGQALYARCLGCHALAYDRTGPRHCGLLGRRAGSMPGFDYSPAMKASDIIWTKRTLDRFLANPTAVVPGTSMGYAGVASAEERAALVAWLEYANGSALCGTTPGKP